MAGMMPDNAMSRSEIIDFLAELIKRAEVQLADAQEQYQESIKKKRHGETVEALIRESGYRMQREALIHAWEMATDETWPPT